MTVIESPLEDALSHASHNQVTRIADLVGVSPRRLRHMWADRSNTKDLAPWIRREVAAVLGRTADELWPER